MYSYTVNIEKNSICLNRGPIPFPFRFEHLPRKVQNWSQKNQNISISSDSAYR